MESNRSTKQAFQAWGSCRENLSLVLGIFGCAILSACASLNTKSPNKVDAIRHNTSSSQDTPAETSPTDGTRIYRHLTSVFNATPDDGTVADLCMRSLGFKTQLPEAKISLARDISLPVREDSSKEVTIDVPIAKRKVETYQPPSINGIIMNTETRETVTYEHTTKTVTRNQIVSGLCVGTEYILE